MPKITKTTIVIYKYLALAAIVVVFISLIISLYLYIIGEQIYIYYAGLWGIALAVDIYLWYKRPRVQEINRIYLENTISSNNIEDSKKSSICECLREIAELVSILYTIEKNQRDYTLTYRVRNIIDRIEVCLDIIRIECPQEITKYTKEVLNGNIEKSILTNLLTSLNGCLKKNNCRTNIEILE